MSAPLFTFTPGPWRVHRTNSDRRSIKTADRSIPICAAVNSENDAHLIAAAPDLLKAAEALMSSVFAENYRLISPFKELAAAIAKARDGA